MGDGSILPTIQLKQDTVNLAEAGGVGVGVLGNGQSARSARPKNSSASTSPRWRFAIFAQEVPFRVHSKRQMSRL